MGPKRDELLKLVRRSPEVVAAHDKAAWLELFARSAVVEDPVGTTPRRKGWFVPGSPTGDDELGAFYETFIAPGRISFRVYQDIVAGHEVVRDVVIRTELPGGITFEVPAYVHYETVVEDGRLRIARLAAHWSVRSMAAQLCGGGLRGLRVTAALGSRLLRNQRLRGALGYLGGTLRGISRRGPESVRALALALDAGDAKALDALFVETGPLIEVPAGKAITPRDLLEDAGGPPRLRVSGLTSCGWWTSCVFALEKGGARHHGIAFFCFDPGSRRIASARFFWNV